MEAAETTGLEPVESPLVIDHGERISEQPTASSDGGDEFRKHKESRGYVKPQTVEQPAAPETPEPPQAADAEKKPDRWQDPDTGDHYDMRHKVARRIKTVLEDRGKERAACEAAERRVNELTQLLIERGHTPAQAERKAEAAVEADPEPSPDDTTKYPDGQFSPAFIKDMAQWSARNTVAGELKNARERGVVAAHQAAEDQAIQAWQKTLPEVRKKYADFDTVLEKFPNTPVFEPLKEMLFGSPVGSDVAYIVGTQDQLYQAYRNAPNERARVRLLAHVEAQILQRAKGQTKPAPKPTTNAPAPIEPVQTSGPGHQVVDWSRTDDPDQYARWKAQRQTRR